MNFYWNYLAYHWLDHLIGKFCSEDIKGEMKQYEDDLQHFRRETKLRLFCQAQTKRHCEPLPPGFRKVAIDYNWPDTVTLEVVEAFRKEFAFTYRLHECALMLASLSIILPLPFLYS